MVVPQSILNIKPEHFRIPIKSVNATKAVEKAIEEDEETAMKWLESQIDSSTS